MKPKQLSMQSVSGVATLFALGLSTLGFAKTGDKLAGDWEVSLTPDEGSTRPVKDVIHFKQAAVSSDYFIKLGLSPAIYDTVEPKFGPVQFKATSTNEKGATIEWQGTALADSVEGTVTVTTKGGEKSTFSFKGTRKE